MKIFKNNFEFFSIFLVILGRFWPFLAILTFFRVEKVKIFEKKCWVGLGGWGGWFVRGGGGGLAFLAYPAGKRHKKGIARTIIKDEWGR